MLLYLPGVILTHCCHDGEKFKFEPKVVSMGIPHRMLEGIATGLFTRLHVMSRELTADPTGTTVDKTEILAVVTDGNVPVENPRILFS
jgi:hypothetical protein